MKVIYKLDEDDVKKLLADHFEALPEEIQFNYLCLKDEGVVKMSIQIDTVLE